jgi:hypothetical protein
MFVSRSGDLKGTSGVIFDLKRYGGIKVHHRVISLNKKGKSFVFEHFPSQTAKPHVHEKPEMRSFNMIFDAYEVSCRTRTEDLPYNALALIRP